MNAYEVTSDTKRMDPVAIHAFLTQSYWSPGVRLDVVRRAMEGSLCFGVLLEGAQVAFARVITDRATFAYLADVYVLEQHRGKGLSRALLDAVFAHAELQGLRRFMLATRDAHGLYTKYGFGPLQDHGRIMMRGNDHTDVAKGQTDT
jgi:GNAT superfamily N-acetyltransferase